jgi:hypothetical protein
LPLSDQTDEITQFFSRLLTWIIHRELAGATQAVEIV